MMSDEGFTTEPVVGHVVSAERYEYESQLTKQLDGVAERLNTPPRNRERIRLRVGDVDWDETKTLSIDVETFEAVIEWYEETQ